MSDIIDELKVQIDASSESADDKLDKFIDKMLQLQSVITGIKISNATNIANGINQITSSIQNFSQNTKTADFTRVATGMNKLSSIDSASVSSVAKSMTEFVSSMTGIDKIHFDSQSFDALTSSISKLGRASITEAAKNLEFLKTSLSEFVASMNAVGSVTFNADGFASMVNSISRLGSANAAQAVSILPQILTHIKDFVLNINSVGGVTFDYTGLGNLIGGISRLGGVKATQAVKNLKPIKDQLLKFISGLNGIGKLNFDISGLGTLVSSITKLGGKAAGNAIPNIQNLGVALNQLMKTLSKAPVVSQNLIQMTTALANLAGAGSKVGSATSSMYRGFDLFSGSSKKVKASSKGIASAIGKVYATYWILFRAMGMFRKAMDISSDLTEVQNVVDVTFSNMRKKIEDLSNVSLSQYGMSALTAKDIASRYQAMGVAMGFSQKKMSDMSIELTKLAADMASFYNVEQKDVAKSLEAVFTGQTMPLRKYGIDLTQATLKQWALNNGMNANIKSMNAAEKAWLRYQYVMANSQQVMGDFARTSDSWHNQLVLLAGGFQSLGSIVGGSLINAFKPFIRALNSVMLKVIQFAQVVSNALGAIFGWKYEGGGGISDDFSDAADSADDLAGSTGDAAKNTKKMADNLQSFDKMNVISSSNDKGSGGSGGGGAGGAGSADSGGKWVETDSLWKKYTSSLDDLYKLGEYIGNVLTKTLNGIDWNKVYRGAEKFGSGLANFLNGLISPELFEAVGKTIANSLNTVLHGLDSFGETFDWINFGKSIAAGINGFFLNFDFNLLVDTLNVWAVGLLNTIATAIDGVEWAEIARRIADALKRVDWKGILEGVGKVFWSGFNAAVEVTSELLNIDKKTASGFVIAIGEVVLAIKGFDTINKAITNVNKIYPALGKLFKITGPVKYLTIAAGISGIALALDQFGIIDIDWNTLNNALKNMVSVLGKFVVGIGKGLVQFIKDITPIIGPTLETAINGTAKALDILFSALNKIPQSVISGLTGVLTTFFAIWKSTQFVDLIAKTATHLYNMKDAFRLLIDLQIEPLKTSISELFTSMAAHPYAMIAAGIGAIALKIMSLTKEAAKNSSIGQLSDAIHDLNDEISSKTNEINDSLETSKRAIENAGGAETQMARELAKEYAELHDKTNLTAADKNRLKDVSDDLCKIIPDLKNYVSEETGELDIQNQALENIIENYDLLARKKAGQEQLIQAYRDQYAAQANLTNAQEKYNKAFDEYLDHKNIGGMSDAIKNELKEGGNVDIPKATYLMKFEPEIAKQMYGTTDIVVFQTALNNLSKETEAYKKNIVAAQQAVDDAGNSIKTIHGIIEDNDKDIKENNASILAGTLASDKYKQALSDLTTEFKNMGVILSDDFMQNLALEGDFNTSGLQEFFASLSDGVSASSENIQNAFAELGQNIPINLANALSQAEPETQAAAVKMLMSIQSGVEANSNDLKTLFGNLGYDLPNAFAEKLAEKEPSVQTNTLNLLAKINEGYKLTEGNLEKLFSGLGEILPEEFIKSLSGKESDVQAQAINLIGQIHVASNQERGEIITDLKKLGIDGADGLKSGLDEQTGNVKAATDNLISSVESSASGDSIKSKFTELGMSIPTSLANALAKQKPEAQAAMINLLAEMKKGVEVSSDDLKMLFDNLGHTLPDTLIERFSEKEAPVQTNTLNLLAKVDEGYHLTEKNLISLFTGLGNDIPKELIKGLSDSSVKANVQSEAIDLLNQIPAASELKRNEIINKLKQLGIDGADELKKGIGSKKADIQTETENVVGEISRRADIKKHEVYTTMNAVGVGSTENLRSGIEKGEDPVALQAESLTQKLIDTVQHRFDNVTETFNNLGISSANKLCDGIDSKKGDAEASTRNLAAAVKNSISSEFNTTTSGAMYDAGANASKGFWKGFKDWWDDTWLGKKISEVKHTVSGPQGLDEHSPSKPMKQYGAYAGIGFNESFQAEMDKTVPMVQQWIDDLTSTVSGYQIPLSPVLDTSCYPALPQSSYTQQQFEVPDFSVSEISVDYTAELSASLRGSNSELLKELKRNNDLLEQLVNKPVIDDGTIYNATRREVARTFKRTGRTGFKGID